MKDSKDDNQATLVFSQDLKPQWLNIARRMQQAARTQQGLAILSISVIVNADGLPIQWLTPTLACFEPKSQADQFLAFLKTVATNRKEL